jgi:hypothetical protein
MAKLTVVFNKKMEDVLDGLARKKFLCKVCVLWRAIALYAYIAKELKQPGRKLVLVSNGMVTHEIEVP